MSDSLSTRIARLKAVAPDADNIRIAFECNGETWRRERLWNVVRSLTADQASQIAWMEDQSGSLRVGIRGGPRIATSLLHALVSAWQDQNECHVQLCAVEPGKIGGKEWCDIDIWGSVESGKGGLTLTMVR